MANIADEVTSIFWQSSSRQHPLVYLLICLGLISIVTQPSFAKNNNADQNCLVLERSVKNAEPITSNDLGVTDAEIKGDVHCLVGILRASYLDYLNERSTEKNSPQSLSYRVLSAGLLRALDKGGRKAIHQFRVDDDVNMVASLAQGARHPVKGVRVNSANILAEIVDNTTLCAVVDAAWTEIEESRVDTPDIKGRANLLAVARVVAPWARKENYDALQSLHAEMSDRIRAVTGDEKENLKGTEKTLERLKQHLDIQVNLESDPNSKVSINLLPKNIALGKELGAQCRTHNLKHEDSIGKFYKN